MSTRYYAWLSLWWRMSKRWSCCLSIPAECVINSLLACPCAAECLIDSLAACPCTAECLIRGLLSPVNSFSGFFSRCTSRDVQQRKKPLSFFFCWRSRDIQRLKSAAEKRKCVAALKDSLELFEHHLDAFSVFLETHAVHTPFTPCSAQRPLKRTLYISRKQTSFYKICIPQF